MSDRFQRLCVLALACALISASGFVLAAPGSGAADAARASTFIAAGACAAAGEATPAAASASPAAIANPTASPGGTPVARAMGPKYTTGPVTIRLTDEGFAPDRVLSAVGHDLTVTLINTGTRPHRFCIDKLEIGIELGPGESTTFDLNSLPIDAYPYYSNLPADEAIEMRGRLTIFI